MTISILAMFGDRPSLKRILRSLVGKRNWEHINVRRQKFKYIYIYTHTIPKSIEQGIGQPPKRKNNARVISIDLNLDAKIYIRSSIVVFTHPHKQPIATCQLCPPHLHRLSPC